tara:strand:+ start:768 stop:1235 length:468 start_codon:yes stop_codon:yes gene_type:complete
MSDNQNLVEKYPTMTPDPRLIAQCLADRHNTSWGGKQRHPKFSAQQWNVRTHVFDLTQAGKTKRFRISRDEEMYLWQAIDKMFNAIADRQWASETNYRIKKYYSSIMEATRYELKMLYYITDMLNRTYNTRFGPESVRTGLEAYLDRATNGQLMY